MENLELDLEGPDPEQNQENTLEFIINISHVFQSKTPFTQVARPF